jgi:hypothetical protein
VIANAEMYIIDGSFPKVELGPGVMEVQIANVMQLSKNAFSNTSQASGPRALESAPELPPLPADPSQDRAAASSSGQRALQRGVSDPEPPQDPVIEIAENTVKAVLLLVCTPNRVLRLLLRASTYCQNATTEWCSFLMSHPCWRRVWRDGCGRGTNSCPTRPSSG